jgi:hypothetical protein
VAKPNIYVCPFLAFANRKRTGPVQVRSCDYLRLTKSEKNFAGQIIYSSGTSECVTAILIAYRGLTYARD